MIFNELTKRKISYAVVAAKIEGLDKTDYFVIVPTGCSPELLGLRFLRKEDSSNRRTREKDLSPEEISEVKRRVRKGHLEEAHRNPNAVIYQQKGFDFKKYLDEKNSNAN